jgi:hypothetical protein
VWYEIRTALNNRQPLFRSRQTLARWMLEWTGPVMGVEAAEFSLDEAGDSRWRLFFPCRSLLPCQRLCLWDCPLPVGTTAGVSPVLGKPAEIPRRAAAPPG